MKYFSMFSGIGGFELGIQQAYEELHNLRPNELADSERPEQLHESANELQQWECVGYSEIDRYAIQIFEKHYPNIKNYGDATKIDTRQLPDFDLLVGGFPCQAFSIAGKRKGFDDTRGTLFFEIARILADKRPGNFVLENVKGLLSHDGGKTFQTILGVLTDLGYFVEWQVLNSKNFGVPQNRERVFFVGHLGGECRPKVFPIGEVNGEYLGLQPKKNRQGSRVSCLNSRYGQRWNSETYIKTRLKYIGAVMSEKNKKWLKEGKELSREFPQGQRVYSKDGIASTIAGNAGGLGGKTGLYAVSPTIRAEHHNTADVHFIPQGTRIRRLTPTECERLQGFPDGWTEGISDTQRYKCLGNAVTTNVVREVIKRLYELELSKKDLL